MYFMHVNNVKHSFKVNFTILLLYYSTILTLKSSTFEVQCQLGTRHFHQQD